MHTEKNQKIRSSVGSCGGVPTLFVNDAPFPSAAYMTYLEEYNDYASFAKAGYRLFSVPVLFAGRWINSAVDNKPFHNGIFDRKNAPDYSVLDASVKKILAACPDALIFPRLNMSMPLWWIEENPAHTDGTGKRELLFSEKYRETAEEMLRAVIRHISFSDYAPHIVGYQLAGGNTEEWFHFDLNAGYCENAVPMFERYLETTHPDCGFTGLPDLSPLRGAGPYHGDRHLALYLEFASAAVADTVCALCAAAKEETGGTLAVGTFYGYSLEVTSPLWGTHALQKLLHCESLDFICSPNSYVETRAPDADWTEMYPADSVRLHGKFCMQECDVRTHLTRPLWEAAPEYDREKRYTAPIWQGLQTREQALSMLQKTFSRQLIKGNGFWWFDMWGGWYHDPALLAGLRQMREIYADALTKADRRSVARFAVFVDEGAYKYMTDCGLRNAVYHQRTQLGCMGAPYDMYDVFDFEAVYKRCKAVLFLSGFCTEQARRARALCEAKDIPFLCLSEKKQQFSAAELRAFCRDHGIHILCGTDDIIYINKNHLAVHAAAAGVKTVALDGARVYRELLTENGITGSGRTLTVYMQENETKLFMLSDVDETDASGFVSVTDVIPDAILDIRYFSAYNFVGERIDGYEEPAALLTKEAAEAMKAAADELRGKGYRLKIFDAYRPQMAVDHFVRWAKDETDVRMKAVFYPDLEKDALFPLGYIAARSGHSHGSTVDLTLYDTAAEKEADMGGPFDFFGELSHPDCRDVTAEQYANRMLLRKTMLAHGFLPLAEEWWHFTLENEPYPDVFFNFPVNGSAAKTQWNKALSSNAQNKRSEKKHV